MQAYRYLFKFYYIASEKYFGSQRQKDYITVEDCIIDALIKSNYIDTPESAKFEVASRTDRYVSARGAALSFVTLKKPILMEINSMLPREIGFWASVQVPLNFLSRFNALYRHYKYILPIAENGYYKNTELNLKLMRRACKEFEGHHDFHNFFKPGKDEVKTSRDILKASLIKKNGFLIFDFKSQSFLRQQIRRMVAKVLELGMGIIDHNQFKELLNTNIDVSYSGADPRGLILWDVCYSDTIEFIFDSKSIERRSKYFSEQENRCRLKCKLFSLVQHDDIC